jgi:hypothetical protein
MILKFWAIIQIYRHKPRERLVKIKRLASDDQATLNMKVLERGTARKAFGSRSKSLAVREFERSQF